MIKMATGVIMEGKCTYGEKQSGKESWTADFNSETFKKVNSETQLVTLLILEKVRLVKLLNRKIGMELVKLKPYLSFRKAVKLAE